MSIKGLNSQKNDFIPCKDYYLFSNTLYVFFLLHSLLVTNYKLVFEGLSCEVYVITLQIIAQEFKFFLLIIIIVKKEKRY